MNLMRTADVRLGIRIEIITIVWMVIEMAVSVGAGFAAGSILLIAFGIDSLIELASGGILLWRLQIEGSDGDMERVERAEQRATWIVAITLGLLCVYVLVSSVYGLLVHSIPENSPIGIGVSAAALLIMPYLAITKRRISKRINSEALAGDATNSITCAYMAGTVLAGLLLNAIIGWWWAEYAAALLFLIWLIRETLEAFEEAREDGKEE
jgi:divalent metal cation (Fe/Co/Zn/Cd) transporter